MDNFHTANPLVFPDGGTNPGQNQLFAEADAEIDWSCGGEKVKDESGKRDSSAEVEVEMTARPHGPRKSAMRSHFTFKETDSGRGSVGGGGIAAEVTSSPLHHHVPAAKRGSRRLETLAKRMSVSEGKEQTI